ncbi:23S rRNA (adenine(2030)-N(6))-methyltransferase RlmJ [Oleiharenicola lentus]|uniref:23S rRNA (adenine(2030)-N(6))-methyltransferase RlmJ n=1 Tax=Oleiharenicola lentus TaxID=2508720 RepID=UPI003F67D104
MNYRHHYHAGNYADVFKHVLLLQLIRAMQRKEKGFLYLDTHAGRGGYDLSVPSVLPDGGSREPEFPAGIGRFWDQRGSAELPAAINDYLQLVQRFNDRNGVVDGELKFYPGSPWIAKLLLRPQDRMALCELRPDDAEALDFEFARETRVKVEAIDGYNGLKGMLPPLEKRALVLIDPPFETKREFVDVLAAVLEALRRMPSAVIAIWYPITERARTDQFQQGLMAMAAPPPTLFAELHIVGDESELTMKGCGLLVLNPPWQIDQEIRDVLPAMKARLRVDAGAAYHSGWLVREK